MKKFDAITFGSATLDVFLTSKEFKLIKRNGQVSVCQVFGSKIETQRKLVASGGGGTNTAVGLARLGLKTAIAARLGKDIFSSVVLEELGKEKVCLDFLVKKKNELTDFSVILLTEGGGRTILVSRGETYLEKRNLDFAKLKASWFHLSSLEGNLNLAWELVDLADKQKTKVCFNPGKEELKQKKKLKKVLEKTTVLVLNQKEAERLVGLKEENSGFWRLIFKLPPKIIVITQGKKGAWLITKEPKKKLHRPAFSTPVKEETGAGDAFCAGLVAALFYQKSYLEALCWGLANGASVVSCYGAKSGLLKLRKIKTKVEKRCERQ